MKDYILYQDRAIVKVPLSKIYFVTTHPTKAHAVLFVTAEGNFKASTSLSKIEAESTEELIRCHRKFLVNKDKIQDLIMRQERLCFWMIVYQTLLVLEDTLQY